MAYYINSVARSVALSRELKELVPLADVRRRMSRVLKMAVATGMDALSKLPSDVRVDAIITATRMGCLADSERFLREVVENYELPGSADVSNPDNGSGSESGLLNPTPFIQSTFNTAGGQIALLTGNHCYNTTYVHGNQSFESALVDTAIQIDQAGAQHVLVGLFDETTPTLEKINARMRGLQGLPTGDGALFFVISTRPLPGCLGEVESLDEKNLQKWKQCY
jgi:hypothetical protein